MKKSNLIAGIICLAIAGLLAIINSTLSADSMMFMVGDQNMPWVPVGILGVVGLILLTTAFTQNEKAIENASIEINEEKAALNKQLEAEERAERNRELASLLDNMIDTGRLYASSEGDQP